MTIAFVSSPVFLSSTPRTSPCKRRPGTLATEAHKVRKPASSFTRTFLGSSLCDHHDDNHHHSQRPSTFAMTAQSQSRTLTRLSPPISSLLFIIANYSLTILFKRYSIAFPPALSGMLILFTLLSLTRFIFPRRSSTISAWSSRVLAPGTTQISKWLAIFFAPNLVMLPLAPTLATSDVVKVALVTVFGFLCSLISTALFVIGIKNIFQSKKVDETQDDQREKVVAKTMTLPWPETGIVQRLAFATVFTFIAAVTWSGQRSIKILLDLLLTITCFAIGMRFPKPIKTLMHPLVFCTVGTIGGLWLFGFLSGAGFNVALVSYLTRGALRNWGGGDILAWLAGPAVISFGCQMDNRRKLIRQRSGEIFGSTILASVLSLFGTAAAVRYLRVGPKARLFMLPRMITAPLAVSIAQIIKADVRLASTVVAVTGLLGANFGPAVLNLLRFRDPVARGLAIGSASHGLGTAGLSDEENAFPFAAIAMTVVGIVSTLIVAVPALRAALVAVAVGKNRANLLAMIKR